MMSKGESKVTWVHVKGYLEEVPTEALLKEAMRRTFTHVDMTEHSLLDTPKRLAKFWAEFNCPTDINELLTRSFDNSKGSEGMVVQTDIPLRGLCEHHLAPFFGVAHIGYLPQKRVIGLSKLARLVDAVSTRRPSVQETVTREIADLLHHALGSLGSIVVIKATHTCMTVRGVKTPGVFTTTSSVTGLFRNANQVRDEFFRLVGLGGNHE
jgi:GTP cyclohydrolase IA